MNIAEVIPNRPGPVQTLPMGVPAPRGRPGDRSAAGPDSPAEPLPPALSAALADFCRHLAAERALSRHTVRAYHGDIQSLLEYAARSGVGDPGSLDLTSFIGRPA